MISLGVVVVVMPGASLGSADGSMGPFLVTNALGGGRGGLGIIMPGLAWVTK